MVRSVRDYDEKDVVLLRDGLVTDFRIKTHIRDIYDSILQDAPSGAVSERPTEYFFDLMVVSTGEVHKMEREFTILVKNGEPLFLWQGTNGQIFANFMSDEAKAKLSPLAGI